MPKLRLRAWRQHRGMTQVELARRAALTQQAVSEIERGRVDRPHANTLRALARALRCGLEDLRRTPNGRTTR